MMYNRYIPQPDGSYRKNRVQEPIVYQQTRAQNPVKQEARTPPPEKLGAESCPPPPCPLPVNTNSNHKNDPQQHTDAGDFLRRLLPKDLDTGDLLIIILLLLMAGDCKEEKNTALLTLALYFFL